MDGSSIKKVMKDRLNYQKSPQRETKLRRSKT